MTEQTSLYIAALKDVEWQDINDFEPNNQVSIQWLQEKGSLSRRLERKCDNLTVHLLHNSMVGAESMTEEEKSLLSDSECLLREVILSGDGQQWVVGRTLIPETSLAEQPYNLTLQGNIPLGLTVFSVEGVSRDALEFGWTELNGIKMIARRSRLWMNNKPMLVAELFLPGAPVYFEEKDK